MSFTNIEATQIAHLVGKQSSAYSTSVAKMSSGKRIINPAVDAGGLSMQAKLSASGERHKLAMQNMLSAVSRSQTQVALLQEGVKTLERMEELSVQSMGPIANSHDRENYNKEFQELLTQFKNITQEKLLGSPLFGISEYFGGQSIKVANPQGWGAS